MSGRLVDPLPSPDHHRAKSLTQQSRASAARRPKVVAFKWLRVVVAPVIAAAALNGILAVEGQTARTPVQPVQHPRLQGEWASIGPDGGADVRVIAIDPSSTSTIYVGTSSSGLFKSVDGGVRWLAMNNGIPALSSPFVLSPVSAVAVDPQNPSLVYAATGAFHNSITQGTAFGAVFVSTSGGKEWGAPGQGLPTFSLGTALVVDTSVSGTAYAGFYPSGVFKTTDSGATWSPVNKGLVNGSISSLAIDPIRPQTVYAGTGLGVAKTVDGGATWAHMTAGMSKLLVRSVAVAASQPSTLYASAESSSGVPGFFRSTDGGANWSESTSPGVVADSIAIDSANSLVVYRSTRTGIMRSADGGQTWTGSPVGLPRVDLTEPLSRIAVSPHDSRIVFFGSPDGLFASVDGGASWLPSLKGLSGLNILAVAAAPTPSETVFALAEANRSVPSGSSEQLIAKSTDGGGSWLVSALPNTYSVYTLAVDRSAPETIYAAGDNLYRSTDGGGTWVTLLPSGPPSWALFALAVPSGPAGTLYLASPTGGAFRSADSGTTVVPINTGLPPPHSASLTAIAVDQTDASTLYVGGFGVFRSADAGATWTLVLSGGYYRTLLVVPTIPAAVYAASGSDVYRSVDRGVTWTLARKGLPASIVQTLAFDPTPPGSIYAATIDAGVFRTDISRIGWTPVGVDLANPMVWSLAVSSSGGRAAVFAGTHGDGVGRYLSSGSPPVPFRK